MRQYSVWKLPQFGTRRTASPSYSLLSQLPCYVDFMECTVGAAADEGSPNYSKILYELVKDQRVAELALAFKRVQQATDKL